MAAAHLTTYDSVSPVECGKAMRDVLKTGHAHLITERFGQPYPLGKNQTNTAIFRQWQDLALATAPLMEGSPDPEGQRLHTSDISVTLKEHGDFVPITSVIKDTHTDPVFRIAQDKIAKQIRETIETIRLEVLKAGSTVFYANNAATRAAVDSPPLAGDFLRIERFLANHRAEMIDKIVEPGSKISTTGIEESFWVMGAMDLKADIKAMPNFVPVHEYGHSGARMPYEVGSVGAFRFVLSPIVTPWKSSGVAGTDYLADGNVPSGAAACDVYPLIIVAKDAYGIVPLQGQNVGQINVKNPSEIDSGNKLGREGFVSWKIYEASKILHPNWLVRYEVAATAKPE